MDEGADEMRRIAWGVAALLLIMVVLTGCGQKNAADIVSDLSKRYEKMEGYTTKAKMTIHTGKTPQIYEVEVWYKQPNFYRVSLKNTKKDITQILLRNDDGVYVLTPHLNKSFRFQSDWPESSGQIYLYQSLINSIIDDQSRGFKAGSDGYQFDVRAKTNNQTLSRQRIWLNKDLYPTKAVLLNDQDQVMVEVTFDRFNTDPSFDKDAFDMNRNMNGLNEQTLPSMRHAQTDKNHHSEKEVEAMVPGYVPKGSQLVDEQTVVSMEGEVVIMRYQGRQPFTLTQKNPDAVQASAPMYGQPVDLGYTVGILLEGSEKKRLSWTHNNTEFELYGNLPVAEMVKIAQSVQDQPKK